MATVDYSILASEAAEIINEYGSAAQFVRKGTKGGYDSNGDPIADSPDVIVSGIATPLAMYKAHEIDGTSIIAGDSRVTFQGDDAPDIGMQYTVNSKDYRVVNVYTLSSNVGEIIYYTVQLRYG